MHAAPSVSYPVGRSALAGWLLALAVLAALALALFWCWQAAQVGWRQASALAATLACGGVALAGWLRSPRGSLHWDGGEWRWEPGASRAGQQAGRPEIALDLQSRLLLHWRGTDAGSRWLCLEQASAPLHWEALRRAVYSPASHAAPPGAPSTSSGDRAAER
jgi:toxin CptA